MNHGKNALVSWMLTKAKKRTDFPQGTVDYADVYEAANSHLNNSIHPTVVAHASVSDRGGFLTDHGPDHIAMVMSRALDLTNSNAQNDSKSSFGTQLTGYEAFILLMAIHGHDIGNVYGRDGHEKRVLDGLNSVPALKVLSPSELRIIARIAAAHGGVVNHSKDTIGQLHAEGALDLRGKSIRPQLLAAILRLADELADDHSRADSYGLTLGIVPPESEIYHQYAKSLDSVKINTKERRVTMRFYLSDEDAVKEFGKGKRGCEPNRVFLLDEIYGRTVKTFKELNYCMGFMRSWPIYLQKLDVKIEICRSSCNNDGVIRSINYVLSEQGYPYASITDISAFAKEFDNPTGEELCREINNQFVDA